MSPPAAGAPLRVVITVPWGERLGGAETFLHTALERIDRGRVDPMVVFLQGGSFERDVAAIGIRTRVLPSSRLRHLVTAGRTAQMLARLLRDEQPDLVLNWMPKTQVYGSVAAMLAGMADRVVWWQHGIPQGNWLDRLATALPTRAVGCASRTSAAAQRLLWPRRPTFVVHPGVGATLRLDDDRLTPVRAALRIPAGTVVLGAVGRLQPLKGQDRLLRVLARLRSQGRSVHGLVVGGDAYHLAPGYEAGLHRLASRLGITDAVTFTGQVADPLPHIAVMDVLVNPSQSESFGIVLLEAMALGVPIVAVDSGGPSEIVEPERSGLLVEATDDALHRAVLRLLDDPPLRHRLGAAGRARFEAHFTAEAMAGRFQAALETCSRQVAGAPPRNGAA